MNGKVEKKKKKMNFFLPLFFFHISPISTYLLRGLDFVHEINVIDHLNRYNESFSI